MTDANGVDKPVEHACGHDIHISCLLGAVEALYAARKSWSGTLVFAFQPAEERGTGAQRMIDDGLYYPERYNVPIPDIVLGAHVLLYRAGVIGTRRGLLMSATDSMRVTLHGRSGYASIPNRLMDPVIMAASTVMRLQTIVSREVDA
jgi:metal-dependent amidase/aminoacylase/carboxypeptidase family protein